jgi:hypothetical protein
MPGLTALAVLSLALGIGANVTVFAWARGVLLEPFGAVPDQDRLVTVLQTDRNEEYVSLSYPDYEDLRDRSRGIADLAVMRNVPVTLGVDGRSERAWAQLVSGNFFEVLRVGAAKGRVLTPADDRDPGAHPVVVLGHAFWERRFAGDPAVVGRTIVLNTRPYTVLGVAPRGFRGAATGTSYDAWVPMMMQEQLEPGGSRLEQRGYRWLAGIARLAPGVSRERAEAEMTVSARQVAAEHEREELGRGVALFPLWRSPRSGAAVLGPVIFLLGAVSALVLLLACANLASLLLARGVQRRREIAIRLSLGASRGDLVRQLLVESLLLALAGAAAGLAVASFGYVPGKDESAWGYFNNVGPGYFALMRTPMVRGREFGPEDRDDSEPVAVVNETMAARYWPGGDAIGGRFRLGDRWLTVVGVARDATYREIGERPAPWFFLPLRQGYRPDMTLLVRTGGDTASLSAPLLELVRQLDPQIAPFNVTTLEALVGAADFRQRAGSQLLGLFGALGLALACVGLYGVLSFSVARRTREIGIRMALGGARRDVFRLVLGQGARLAGLGLLLGIAAAAAASRLMRSLLVGLSPWDPAAFAGVALLLLAAAFVACAVPARRATRVDPATALRQE